MKIKFKHMHFGRNRLRLKYAMLSLAVLGIMLSFYSVARADGDSRPMLIISMLLFEDRAAATALSVGEHHNCVRLEDGGLACWGYNLWGQLGDGNDDSIYFPSEVRGIHSALVVAAGVRHSCAVLEDGKARCWGNNGSGQLGNNTHGNSTHSFIPVDVNGMNTGASISTGDEFSCAVLTNGTVQCWGRGTDGQLGNAASGALADRDEPESVNLINYTSVAVSNGGFHACMIDDYAPLVLPLARCWGRNTSGQLGQDNYALASTPLIVKNSAGSGSLLGINSISAGDDHSCATISTGLVFCWGWNGRGQIGLPANAPSNSNLPVQVSTFGTLLPAAVSVSAGGDHSCALTSDNKVWCWGFDVYGQLGRGTSAVADHVPVAVSGINTAIAIGTGEFHSCALLEDRSVWCWGRNHHLQLGVKTPASSNVPVKVSGLTEIVSP